MSMQVESASLFEAPHEICERVFRALKPRTKAPAFVVEFCKFANPDSFASLKDGMLHFRISDLLAGAPPAVLEALAYILIGKLFRKPVPAHYSHRYRVYLNRKDMRRSIHLVRQIRGRKFVSGPAGSFHNLEELFDELNVRYFDGMMARPLLGWSRLPSRTTLGHYDPSHNAIILSRILDGAAVPQLAVKYVLFHEMLHLRYPTEHEGSRRRVHTKEFRNAERKYPFYREAKELLKRL